MLANTFSSWCLIGEKKPKQIFYIFFFFLGEFIAIVLMGIGVILKITKCVIVVIVLLYSFGFRPFDFTLFFDYIILHLDHNNCSFKYIPFVTLYIYHCILSFVCKHLEKCTLNGFNFCFFFSSLR